MMEKRVPLDTYCEKKIPTLQKTYDGLIDYATKLATLNSMVKSRFFDNILKSVLWYTSYEIICL